MALAQQANNTKLAPRMIAVLGASGAGKTVYLGMLLDMLSRQPEQLQVLARGAFSVTLQQATVSALVGNEFPQKTSSEPDRWNWVHCQVQHSRGLHPAELMVPDMAGEALLEEVDHPHSYPVIGAFLRKCNGALVLVDAGQLHEGAREPDFFTLKLLTYLSELDSDPKQGWSRRPVALVFSKADQAEECRDDPAAYAEAHAGGLWRFCQERFACHQFFAASVAGSCAWRQAAGGGPIQVPLRIEPHGVVEPFVWLLQRLEALRKRNGRR
jgi:hypothetical protein